MKYEIISLGILFMLEKYVKYYMSKEKKVFQRSLLYNHHNERFYFIASKTFRKQQLVPATVELRGIIVLTKMIIKFKMYYVDGYGRKTF